MLRRIATLCVMLAYLLAGALHGACDLDLADHSAGKREIASVVDKVGHSDQRGITDHHCHGCFSVTVPQLQLASVPAEIVAATDWPIPVLRAGVLSESESPPPKNLV
jgi:hypothetical protein